jgi:hypothetical protein
MTSKAVNGRLKICGEAAKASAAAVASGEEG